MIARDELARDIFIADNSRYEHAGDEWDALCMAGVTTQTSYAFNIADRLLVSGYRKRRPIKERIRSWWRANVIDWDPYEPEAQLGNIDRWDGLR